MYNNIYFTAIGINDLFQIKFEEPKFRLKKFVYAIFLRRCEIKQVPS